MIQAFIFAVIFFSAVIQISFLPNFFPAGAVPDLLLVFIILWSMKKEIKEIWIWILLTGLFLDFFSLLPAGTNISAVFTVVFLIRILMRQYFITDKVWKFFTSAGFVIIGTLVNEIVLFLILKFILKEDVVMFSDKNFYLRIAYNLMTFLIIYWPFAKFEKVLEFYNHKNKIIR